MTEEQLYHYIVDLWAMLIWGNKQYVIDKLIDNNGFEPLNEELAEMMPEAERVLTLVTF